MDTSIEHIIIRHLSRTASKEEELQLHIWREESEANQKEFEATQKLWQLTEGIHKEVDFDTEAEWEDFQATIGAEPVIRELQTSKRPLFKDFLRIAAVFLLMIGGVWLAKQVIQPSGAIVESVQIETLRNMQREVKLEDGSKVWMNEYTVLTFPEKFDSTERKVRLVGEAFFEVARDENRPFVILNKNTETRVLGTSFNLRTTEENVEVTVRTGKVSLASRADNAQSVTLEAGEKGVFDVETKVLNKVKVEDENDWSWQTERLVFTDTPLSRVMRVLSKHYNIRMDARNKMLLNCLFTSEFEAATLEEVMEVLATSLQVKIKLEAGTYWIEGKGC
ncbi:MAG: FecR domain-containing protein [Chitinophagales bacterium]